MSAKYERMIGNSQSRPVPFSLLAWPCVPRVSSRDGAIRIIERKIYNRNNILFTAWMAVLMTISTLLIVTQAGSSPAPWGAMAFVYLVFVPLIILNVLPVNTVVVYERGEYVHYTRLNPLPRMGIHRSVGRNAELYIQEVKYQRHKRFLGPPCETGLFYILSNGVSLYIVLGPSSDLFVQKLVGELEACEIKLVESDDVIYKLLNSGY